MKEETVFFLLFGGFALFIVYSIFASMDKAKEKAGKLQAVLEELRHEVMVVISSVIPGKEIKQVFGNVSGISDTNVVSREEFALAEKEAMHNLILEAKKLGANAVVGLKLSTSTYEHTGSQWQVSQLVYLGTAVSV